VHQASSKLLQTNVKAFAEASLFNCAAANSSLRARRFSAASTDIAAPKDQIPLATRFSTSFGPLNERARATLQGAAGLREAKFAAFSF
jgi:hypothetical protein